jgi:tetratricopeptide (TPR) repeat protein
MRGASVASAASPVGPAIDAYRALLDEGMPRKAAALFQALLDAPATPLGPVDVFRIKVNLGLCRWLLDDKAEAARLIEEGCDAAPAEPKAIANRVLVLMLRGRADEAFEYAKRELSRTPASELLASHLYRIALELGEVDEPIGLIPPDLQKTESVLLLRTLFLRNREVCPLWWDVAAEASERFPANKTMALFAAEAVVDRNVNANLGRGWLTVSEAERPGVEQSLLVLEASWERIRSSENPDSDEGSAILNTQMLAKRLLGDRDGALAIGRALILRPVQPKLLINAAQIALTFHDGELVDACLAKLPPGGDFDYFRGMLALSRGLWGEAARHFKVADYPEEDARLVAAVLRLAPVAESRDPIQADEVESLGADDSGDARVPVLLATVARRRGLDDLAKRSFERAVRMLRDDSGMPERIMVAGYAERAGEFGTVVDVLSGHVETAVLSAELQQLADGHAGEQPRKKRNRKFFENLPADVRQATGIARAYATVLLDAREYRMAEGIFRQIIADRPDDAYSHLRLVETLRREDDEAGVRTVVRSADERPFLDQPRHAAQWALLLRDADEPSRALALAYELVRKQPDSAKVALGYIGLILGGRNFDSILATNVCGQDCFVALTSARGERHEFVIDQGGSILGIEAVSAGSDRARRVLGLALNAQLEEEWLDGQTIVWTLSALASKYLHVLHVLMNQFQIRYPGSDGIRRLDVVDGNITPLLDMIRNRSDAVREGVFDLYVKKKLPLVLVGRALGGDEMWLAQRIREFKLDVETCSGAPAETAAALALMTESRGAGAVLDAYTAWVCADMGLLEEMRSWFGALFLSQGVIDKIDQLIAREQATPGQEALSLSWLDGQFFRHVKDGDFVQSYVAALTSLREELLLHCEIVSVAMPDDINETIAAAMRKFGSEPFEAIYVAAERNAVLISEDMHYRMLALACAKVRGGWIQSFLIAAQRQGKVPSTDHMRNVVRLAYLHHNLVQIDNAFLIGLFETEPDPDLTAFRAVCRFLGGASAAMWGHCVIVIAFLQSQWSKKERDPRLSLASSIILGALLREREDWPLWLSLVLLTCPGGASRYIAEWSLGHFLPLAPIMDAIQFWRKCLRVKGTTSSISGLSTMVAEFGVSLESTTNFVVPQHPPGSDNERDLGSRVVAGERESKRRRRRNAAHIRRNLSRAKAAS